MSRMAQLVFLMPMTSCSTLTVVKQRPVATAIVAGCAGGPDLASEACLDRCDPRRVFRPMELHGRKLKVVGSSDHIRRGRVAEDADRSRAGVTGGLDQRQCVPWLNCSGCTGK